MATFIGNAFSLNMIDNALTMSGALNLRVKSITLDDAISLSHGAVSVVGHVDTANILSGLMGKEITFNRQSLSLQGGDHLIVGQYVGQRLAEGTKTLPEGSSIKWMLVSV